MFPSDALQALIDTFRREFGARLDTLELQERVHHVELLDRLNRADLNGDASALHEIADAAPAIVSIAEHEPELVTLAAHAPTLTTLAVQIEEGQAGLRWLRRLTRWDQGVGTGVKWFLAGVIGVAAVVVGTHLFGGSGSVAPSLPPVSPPAITMPATPQATPLATPRLGTP